MTTRSTSRQPLKSLPAGEVVAGRYVIERILGEMVDACEQGHRVVFVSSGAIGAGLAPLGFRVEPVQLDLLRQSNGKIVRPPAPVYTTLEGIYGLNLNRVLAGSQTVAIFV